MGASCLFCIFIILEYTTKPGDNSGSLSGQVSFDSNFGSAKFLGDGFNTVAARRLITDVTFTYTLREEPLTIVTI